MSQPKEIRLTSENRKTGEGDGVRKGTVAPQMAESCCRAIVSTPYSQRRTARPRRKKHSVAMALDSDRESQSPVPTLRRRCGNGDPFDSLRLQSEAMPKRLFIPCWKQRINKLGFQ